MRFATSATIVRPAALAPAVPAGIWPQFISVAILAAGFDLLTKLVATGFLADGRIVSVVPRFALMLVYNTGSAGGVSIGPYTWALNVLVTFAAIALVTRIVTPLATVDPRATTALAVLSGGAFGNLVSMLSGPEGVADFLAVTLRNDTTIVMNVADLLLWSGALMLIPVVARLLGAIRAERLTQ